MATPVLAEAARAGAAPQADPNVGRVHQTQRLIAWTLAVSAILFLLTITSIMFAMTLTREILAKVAVDHFAGLFGPPMCVLVALVAVIVLRVTHGPMEFEAMGFKFKGASGPVVLYILTYLASVAGMVALWNVK